MLRVSWLCSRCSTWSQRSMKRAWLSPHRLQSTATSSDDYIIPSLLERARSITKEHSELSNQLSNGYDAKIAKKVGELTPIVTALQLWEKANESINELNALLLDSNTDPELRDLARQDLDQSTEELKQASQSLMTSLVPKHPFAHLSCLLEIRPGVGGGEAAIFARDLLNMYQAFCSQNRLRSTLVKEDDGGTTAEDSLTEAVLEVETPGAYDLLRCEAGVHRVQRVPATEVKGRVHTSTAAVMVLPAFPKASGDFDINDPSSDFYIDPKEVRRDFMRASGAGGQHVNKTESAVRLTHLPTNTVVSIQDSRTRANNEDKAWSILRSRIAHARREAKDEENRKLRRSVIGVAKIGRADKVRTYNWQQQRVTDHRSGFTIHGLDGVLEGGVNLQKLMESVRQWQRRLDVEDIVADPNISNIKN